MNGFLLVDKPKGVSSFGALKQLNKKFSIQRRAKKLGHGGTLDPEASGLLVVAVGKATRCLRFFLGSDKRYTATVELGRRTTTDDQEGEVLAVAPYDHVTQGDIEQALEHFKGTIAQIPPAFSALHVDGKRAYDLARSGKNVELKPRQVTIQHIHLIDSAVPKQPTFRLDIACSGGTYIRSIARDLGPLLQTEATLFDLRRTKACHFDIQQAHTLEFLLEQEDIVPFILPCANGLIHLESVPATPAQIHALLNGQPVNFNLSKDGVYKILFHGELVAVIERKQQNNDFLRLISDQEFRALEGSLT